MRIASVILDIPSRAIDEPFSYLVPPEMQQAAIGCPVRVGFGNRPAIGYIVSIHDPNELADTVDPEKLKPIQEVVGPPAFNEDGAACALYLAETCIAPLSQCIRLFTPPGGVPKIVKKDGAWQLVAPRVAPVDQRFVRLTESGKSYQPRANAVKQQAILRALKAGELKMSELAVEFGSVSSTIETLRKKGVVSVSVRRRMRGVNESSEDRPSITYGTQMLARELTKGQVAALSAISALLDSEKHGVVLLDGVTGSGKTEVYLQAIQRVLDKGGNALVLVPEISLTPQTVARFRGRFGDRVAVLHSRMGTGERFDQWDYVASGSARVLVGARSALFAPLSNLGIIVIDEEHDGSYKQDSSPRYQARDVAEWMAKRHGIPLVLGSATPAIETLFSCEHLTDWERVEMPERANGKELPEVRIVDMALEFRGGSRSMFSGELLQAIEKTLVRQEKLILLLNQRGFAQFLLCRDCGFVPNCPNCSTSLTYHEREHALVCHHCQHSVAVPARCPSCNSPYLKRFGAGTQRVEQELAAKLDQMDIPQARIIRMDADTTRGKDAHRQLLDAFTQPGGAVLLGTQMIAKGLDIAEVTLVGVINADTQLNLPDFRSSERTYQLIEQVSGRAGRADLPGKVIVQTYQARNPAIQAAARHNRSIFLADELQKRKALRYPPYSCLANVLVWGKDRGVVQRRATEIQIELSKLFSEHKEPVEVLPASPCLLEMLRGSCRWHVLVRAPRDFDLAGYLAPFFKTLGVQAGVFAAVDPNPSSLF